MPHSNQMTEEMRECIAACLNCHAACTETAAHELMLVGDHVSAEHQQLLADCAQACITSAGFMLRLSPFHAHYCGTCADVCKACGDACERRAKGDTTIKRCTEACRHCEKTCRTMAHAMV